MATASRGFSAKLKKNSKSAKIRAEILSEHREERPCTTISTVGEFAAKNGRIDLKCAACGREETLGPNDLLARFDRKSPLSQVRLSCTEGKCASIATPRFS